LSPVPNVDVGPDLDFYKGETLQLNAEGEFLTILWDPPLGISDSSIANPIYFEEQDANLFISVENEFQCYDFDTMSIRYLGCKPIVIPSAFSPNGDGENDILKVEGRTIDELYLAIYDRWGELVFETTDPDKGWDGRFNGELSEPDVYGFYLKIRCANQQEYFKKGNITLLR